MSAVIKEQMSFLSSDDDEKWAAIVSRDRRFDGQFVFAVSSTKIYCRPSCPSRRPRRERVSYFNLPETAEQAGFRACRRCHPRKAEADNPQLVLARNVCRLLEESDGEPLTLSAMSDQLGVSQFHLQRTFKSVMGVSPSEYAETLRMNRFKKSMQSGEPIASALYGAGFSSSSRLYERAASQLGMTPATYGKSGRGAVINSTVVESPMGYLLVAATEKGVCSVKLGDSPAELKKDLAREFSAAEIKHDSETLREAVQVIVEYLDNRRPHVDLPLDIRATAFQRSVWEQLRAIPRGQTASYTDVAMAIGQKSAVRAVARACATNPVALVIPCHRVIREDKSLGGYRWGLKRKQQLLEKERASLKK